MSLSKLKILILATLAIVVGALHVYFWKFEYNSDYAMIGLLAKRILEAGEQFIYVPKVGYQGLLYEANLVALMFKLFGVSPVVLNYAPFLTFLPMCFVFYKAVKAWYGSDTAWTSTFLVILSSPLFYAMVLRTQPNYTETFLMGFALIWIYRRILDQVIDRGRPRFGSAVLFGAIAGFGIYTYGQIIMYLGAIAAHISLLAIQDTLPVFARREKVETSADRWIWRVFSVLKVIFTLSLILRLLSWRRTHLLNWEANWFICLPLVVASTAALIVTVTVSSLIRHREKFRGWTPSVSAFSLAFVIGLSPKFYYHFVQQGGSEGRMGIYGRLNELLGHIRLLFLGHADLLNFSLYQPLSWVAGIMVAVCFGMFSIAAFKKGLEFVRSGRTSARSPSQILDDWMSMTPFTLLPWVVIASFLVAHSVWHTGHVRYALTLTFSYAVAMSATLLPLLKTHLTHQKRALITTGIVALLFTNSHAIYKSLTKSMDPQPIEPVMAYLKEKGISAGYGGYWYSYAINLLTNEKVVIEPLVTNYIPYYLSRVQGEKRVAFIDKEPYTGGYDLALGNIVDIYGERYKVFEKAGFNGLDVFTLEKL